MPGRGELQNEFSWSKSRDGIFNSCLRAYYYRYYGSWNGWRHDAPADVRELYVMKNLQSFPMWKGSVVHRVVKQVVSGLSEGKLLSVDRALASIRERMLRDYEDSRTGRYRQRPNRICGLLEHYYDTAISDQSLQEAVVFAEGCIKRLYTAGSYRKMLQLGPSNIVEFESLQSITLSGYKVWVSPDVILRDVDDKMIIVDWKTGGSSLSDQTRLQLAIYGLYVAQRYGMPSGLLVGVEENLRSGREHVYPLKEWILEDARRYMEDSIQKMQSLLHDRERNVALFRDFPMTDKLALCMGCSFRRACFRGGNT